jgi:hypothetical protein
MPPIKVVMNERLSTGHPPELVAITFSSPASQRELVRDDNVFCDRVFLSPQNL